MVEAAVVTLLVGILAAIATPRVARTLSVQRCEAAARRVAADLRLARIHARRTSQPQTVAFDAAADSYAVTPMRTPDRPADAYVVALSGAAYRADLVAASFGAGSSVQFDMYGRPSAAGSVTVSCPGRTRTVAVDSSGQVSMP